MFTKWQKLKTLHILSSLNVEFGDLEGHRGPKQIRKPLHQTMQGKMD